MSIIRIIRVWGVRVDWPRFYLHRPSECAGGLLGGRPWWPSPGPPQDHLEIALVCDSPSSQVCSSELAILRNCVAVVLKVYRIAGCALLDQNSRTSRFQHTFWGMGLVGRWGRISDRWRSVFSAVRARPTAFFCVTGGMPKKGGTFWILNTEV